MSERERPSDVVAETHLAPTGSLTGVAPRSRWGSKDIRAARAGPQPARIQTVGVAQRASAWCRHHPPPTSAMSRSTLPAETLAPTQ